jgi:hypothetical protein
MTGGYVRYGIVGGGGAVTALAFLLACSTSDSASPAPADQDSGPDGTTITVATDAEAGPADAGLVDAPDAAPRTCSDQSFCRTALPTGQVLRGVWGDGNGTVWSVSEAGSILRWDGAAWNIHATNTGDRYLSIWGVSPTDLWVGGSNGLLHGTGATPSTITFTPVAIPGDPTVPITAIWGASATDIWAVGGSISSGTQPPFFSHGRAAHLVDGAWVAEGPAPTNVAYTQVWGTPSSGVWIGGSAVTFTGFPSVGLFRRAVGATSFATVNLPPAPAAGGGFANPSRLDVGIATSDTSLVVLGAARTAGTSRKTSDAVWDGVGASDAGADGGTVLTVTWSVEPKGPLPDTVPVADFQLTAAWTPSPSDLWVAGLYGRLRHWNGTAWSEASLTVTSLPETAALYGIWGVSASDFWVVGDNLAIHKHAP